MDTPEVLCFRCGRVWTRKRADGKPVCQLCFLTDALANHGIAANYQDLTPVKAASIPQASPTLDAIVRAERVRAKASQPTRKQPKPRAKKVEPLTPTTKRKLETLTQP